MKAHRKTQKMSRIRVAAFKKRMKLIKIKKHPKIGMSLMYNKTVVNNTIPDVEKENLIEYECPWNKERKLLMTKNTAQKDGAHWYRDLRKKAKATSVGPDGIVTKQPHGKQWYTLSAKDATKMYNKTVIKKMTNLEYIDALTEYKFNKWLRKNPRPIKANDDQKDLFESQFLPKWMCMRDTAKERIRDSVISKYDKLNLYARHVKNRTFSHEEKIAEIKDTTGEGHDPAIMPKTSKLYKKAEEIITKKADKDSTITSGRLQAHNKKKGRIILPKSKQLKMAA